MSMMPYMVACAIAAPETASAARATRDFFMSKFSKVKQRGFSELKPTSFLEVGAIAPERAPAGKGFLALWGQCVAGLQQVLRPFGFMPR
jgi:hypothetical protein